MRKLMPKAEFVERFLMELQKRENADKVQIGVLEPVVRSGISREETIRLTVDIFQEIEVAVNAGDLGIELKSLPYHTPGDIHDIVHKFELNKARIRTNAICFCLTLVCCFLGFYLLTSVNLVWCILVSSFGSGLITFVWDNKENPGAIPSSDL